MGIEKVKRELKRACEEWFASHPPVETPTEKMDLRDKVQDFVNHVCEREGWEPPRVEIPSWEIWRAMAIQYCDGIAPSEKIFGFSDIFRGRIYISPRHVNHRSPRTYPLQRG